MKIYLTGFMGSGKSTYGKKLAKIIGYDFVDLDQLIETEIGQPIADFFAEKGEEAFRKIESSCLKKISGDKTIISTGGGTPCFHNNSEFMKSQKGLVVYLKLLEPQLLKRLSSKQDKRPLLADIEDGDLPLFIHEKLNERAKYYCQADLIIQPEQFSPKHLAKYIADLN